ncbi:MAG: O-methyltransferase [Thomasclavelia sp.]
MKELIELKEKAIKDNIPIMQDEGLAFMIELFKQNNFHNCLEIGSAVGYSALMMASNIDDFKVETIELDDNRYNQAKENIKAYKMDKQIIIHHDNALTLSLEKLVLAKYDCLFIDGAKAQYQKFFEKYMPLVNDNGICVVDNLDFHGMVFEIEKIKNRNTRQLVKKIKRFKDWILSNEEYDVKYYHIGDGICVIKKR